MSQTAGGWREPALDSLAWLRGRARAVAPRAVDLKAMGRHPRRDLLAGATVAVVALPLALAFGISSGLGAGAGMVTAVVAGVVAALLGGSRVQVSGPTGAMTVVLIPIVAAHGPGGVLVVGLMAGVMLIALGIAGVGRYMRYVPLPVVEGFTVGIAVVIGLQQVPTALGVPAEGERVLAMASTAAVEWLGGGDGWLELSHWAPVLIALAVAAAMLLGARWRPGWPVSLLAVIVATLVVVALKLPVDTIGAVPTGLPAPSIPVIPWSDLSTLVLPAVAVAALAALESLLSATVSDAMTVGERHDPDRELAGQGAANLAASFFGGVPATAAIARTAVNVRAGATSRLAAVTQSLLLLLVMLGAAKVVSFIPLAALAGVLIATSIQMVEVSSLRALLHSTRADAIILVVTLVLTIAFDLISAVLIGFVAAGAFALRAMARTARLDPEPLTDGAGEDRTTEERELLDEHIVAYRLEGPLFFGAAHAFLLDLTEVSDVKVVVLRMARVATLDATGASVLADTIRSLERREVTVMLSGIRPAHAKVLDQLGVFAAVAHEKHIFAKTTDAIAHARVHVARLPHTPGQSVAAD